MLRDVTGSSNERGCMLRDVTGSSEGINYICSVTSLAIVKG